jgi:hypothetical protein
MYFFIQNNVEDFFFCNFAKHLFRKSLQSVGQIGCSNWSVPSWWGTKHEWFLVLPVGLLGRYLLGVSTPALSDWRARYCLHSKGFGGNSRKVGSGRNRRRVGSGRNRRRVGRRWKPSRNRRTRVVLITSKVLLLEGWTHVWRTLQSRSSGRERVGNGSKRCGGVLTA